MFPDEATWQSLKDGYILWHEGVDLLDVACAYKALLNVLALKFTPSGSIGVINMEIQEMLPRFRDITSCVMIKIGPESRSQSYNTVNTPRQDLPRIGLSLAQSSTWQNMEELQSYVQKTASHCSDSLVNFEASIESEFEFGELVPRRSACPAGATGNFL